MTKVGNILFCGVGGQGVVLASEVAALALAQAGFDVKKSEVHGMARRGGPVLSHLRYGGRVFSPLIEPGGAGVAVAFELLESLRFISYFGPGCRVLVSTQRIPPPAVAAGRDKYPGGILSTLRKRKFRVWPIDALGAALTLGEPRVLGMVMAGALSLLLPASKSAFLAAVASAVPGRYVEANLAAFERGRGMASRLLREEAPPAPGEQIAGSNLQKSFDAAPRATPNAACITLIRKV